MIILTCRLCNFLSPEERSRCSGTLKCAFDSQGNFKQDNWCCQTIHELQKLAREKGNYQQQADSPAHIYTLHIPQNDIFNGYVVIEDEECCSANAIMVNSQEQRPLTLEIAELILKEEGQQ